MRNLLPTDNPSALHHAYVIEGGIADSRLQLMAFLKKAFNVSIGHADLFMFSSESFGVENIADIISANMRKPVMGGYKFLIADFSSISHNAQNALLKTLEEPQQGTYIFLLTQTASTLLPTVLSRVHVVSFESAAGLHPVGNVDTDNFDAVTHAKSFIKMDYAKRLELIKEILKNKEDEKIGDADIESFVIELEKEAYQSYKDKAERSQMKAFVTVNEYLRDASSSTKLLLEYLALSLPCA